MKIAFTGLYRINGSYDKLKQIETDIEKKYKAEYKFLGDNSKVYDYAGVFTLPKENTPQTELLVATNKDAKLLLGFIGENYGQYNFISYPKHDKPYKEIRSMIEAGFRGKPDMMLDDILEKKEGIIHNALEESKKFLAHLAFSTPNKHAGDIKKLNGAEVLEAIKNNCFDFVNGIIKTL